MSKATTPEELLNEQTIRRLYAVAEGNVKDTAAFRACFAEEGYFWDVSAGERYLGPHLSDPVDWYDGAFPDMHRELIKFNYSGDTVVVELTLNGTHKNDLHLPVGKIPATGKEIHAPCCDVFQLKDGKVLSFHCYVAVPVLLAQLGVFGNLDAVLQK